MRDDGATRTWTAKFRDAFRGVRQAARGQTSFRVHFAFAAAVLVAAALMRMPPAEWAILLLCIGLVLTAEMFNSALESLAKAVTREPNAHVRNALDIASAAVLMASLGAAVVGALVFVNRLGIWR